MSPGCDKDWGYPKVMAFLMEIFQVKSIVPDLFHILPFIVSCTNFILQDYYSAINQKNYVGPLPKPRNRIFEKYFSVQADQIRLKLENLKLTRVLHIQFIHNQYSNIFHPLITKQHRNKTIN